MTQAETKRPKLIASGLAVAAMLTAATGMIVAPANADTIESDEPVLTVMTYGSGVDSNVGEYDFDVQVLDRSSNNMSNPVHSLGKLTNSVDLSAQHKGVSGVDLSGILDKITADQLAEWNEKGWVSGSGDGTTTNYNTNLAVIETVSDPNIQQLGGYGMNNGRAVTINLVFSVTGDKVDYTIAHIDGTSGAVTLPEAPSDQTDEYSLATAFSNATIDTVEGVGHKLWKDEDDAQADALTKAYMNRFNFDLRYTPKADDNDEHLDNDVYEFTNQKDAVWDENGDISFGDLSVSLTDALGVSTDPLNITDKDLYFDTTPFSEAFNDTLTFDVTEENEYGATQVTLPTPTEAPDLTINVEWKPADNTFKLTQADDVNITNEYAAPEEATVTFNTQTADVQAPEAQTIVPGQTVSMPTVTRDGYKFTGWYVDPVCTIPYDFTTGVPENITVYAGWEKVAEGKVTVNFAANAEGVNNPETQVIDKDTTATMPTIKRDGYTFTGWYTDPECTHVFDFTKPVTESITLYAGWSQNPTGGQTNPGTNPGTPSGEQTPTPEPVQPAVNTKPVDNSGLAQTGIGIGAAIMGMLGLAGIGTGATLFNKRRH